MDKNSDKNFPLSKEFDLDLELSIIVEKKLLPKKIAETIGEKLKENNITISKDQLYKLVEKIQSAIQNYSESRSIILGLSFPKA